MKSVLKRRAVSVLMGTSLLVLAVPATCETVYLGPGQSIQDAVDVAGAGSVIVLLGDRYEGRVLIDKPITLRGGEARPPAEWRIGFDRRDVIRAAEAPYRSSHTVWISGGLQVTSTDAHLENLYVVSDDSAGLEVVGGSVALRNCILLSHSSAALSLCSGAVVSMGSSSAYGSAGDGIRVGQGCTLTATDCVVGFNRLNGIALNGSATLEGCLIAWNGDSEFHQSENPEDDLGAETGQAYSGIDASGAEFLSLRDSWVFANHGVGVAAVGWEWDCFEEPRPICQGASNVIPGRLQPFENTLGALHPDPGDLGTQGDGVDQVPWDWAWPVGFRAQESVADVEFQWTYRNEEFSVDTTVMMPLSSPGPLERRWFPPESLSQVLAHYSNQTELARIVTKLLRLASAEGYGRLATASFILGFVNANIAYDFDRYEEEGHGYQLPVQTLVMKSGVCRDTAALAAVLLHLAGFDAAYVSLAPVNDDDRPHAIVGLAIDGAWGASLEHEGRVYYVAETGPPGSPHSSFEFGDVVLDSYGSAAVLPVMDSANVVTEVCWFSADDPREGAGVLRVVNQGSAEAEDVRFCYWWDRWRDFDCASGVEELICGEPVAVGDLAAGEWREFVISTDGAPPRVVQRTSSLSANAWDWDSLYVQLEVGGILNTESGQPDMHCYLAAHRQYQCP